MITLILIGAGACFFSGLLVKLFPSSSSNMMYGYRTPRSMRSEHAWKISQQVAGKNFIGMGITQLMLAVIIYFAKLSFGQLDLVIGVAIITLLPLLAIIRTENFLKKSFDRHGNSIR